MNAKLRGLDSANGEAPGPARKSICFSCGSPRRKRSKNKTERELNHEQSQHVVSLWIGAIVATPGALAALQKAEQQPGEFLTRHVNREWGDLSDEDRKENDYSLEHGFRLLSAYRTQAGDKLWIITESDRSVTTLLLPEEY